MRYVGSQAYDLNAAAYDAAAYEQPLQQSPLTALEGGNLDARARSEVSPFLVRAVGYLVTLAIMLFVAGGISVALTSGTVALLQTNSATSSSIKEINAQNGDLRIERSLLTRADRITRIATQNLGMVYASEATSLDLE